MGSLFFKLAVALPPTGPLRMPWLPLLGQILLFLSPVCLGWLLIILVLAWILPHQIKCFSPWILLFCHLSTLLIVFIIVLFIVFIKYFNILTRLSSMRLGIRSVGFVLCPVYWLAYNRCENMCWIRPWLGCSVAWSIFSCTKSLQVFSPVRACTGDNQSMFLFHIDVPFPLSLSLKNQ